MFDRYDRVSGAARQDLDLLVGDLSTVCGQLVSDRGRHSSGSGRNRDAGGSAQAWTSAIQETMNCAGKRLSSPLSHLVKVSE